MQNHEIHGKRFLSIVNDLERRVAPSQMRLPEFNYWPIIRFSLNYKRKMGRSYLAAPLDQSPSSFWRVATSFPFKERFVENWHAETEKIPLELDDCDVLYLTRKTQYTQYVDATVSHVLIDSLRKLTERPGIKSRTYCNDDPRQGAEQFLVDTHFIPRPPTLRPRQYLKPRNVFEYNLRSKIIRDVERVNKIIRKVEPALEISPYEIVHRAETTTLHYYHWLRILSRISPKVIFLSSFSGMHYVCAAARSLGIRVVDIQHGGMNPYHPIVANWCNIPQAGYELLPEIFWCWSSRSMSYIDFPGEAPHRAIVGGNPRAALEFQEQSFTNSLGCASANRPCILVALQYGPEALISQHVREMYFAHKDQFDWIFRLHPMGFNRAEEVAAELEVSVEKLKSDSIVPLHAQLSQIDLLLTNYSTIIYEGIEHGVQVALCSMIGAQIFDFLIASGEVRLATTKIALARILEVLDARRKLPPYEQDKIFSHHLDLVEKTYNDILGDVGLRLPLNPLM